MTNPAWCEILGEPMNERIARWLYSQGRPTVMYWTGQRYAVQYADILEERDADSN